MQKTAGRPVALEEITAHYVSLDEESRYPPDQTTSEQYTEPYRTDLTYTIHRLHFTAGTDNRLRKPGSLSLQ